MRKVGNASASMIRCDSFIGVTSSNIKSEPVIFERVP